jgi:tetratricopeptide (TPR) repeat protein
MGQQKALQTPASQMTAERGVEAAFELIWQDLDAAAQTLGGLLSLFAVAPLPWNLVEAYCAEVDGETLEDTRDRLKDLHLLQRVGEGVYQLHPLIGQFFGDKLNAQADAAALRGAVAATAATIARGLPESPTLEDIAKVTLAIPHLANVANHQREALTDDDLKWIFIGVARFYEGQGIYAQAEPWHQDCLTATKERLGDRHPDVATSLNNLAALYDSQGRYEAAEPLYVEALQLRKDLLGDRHPDVATSLNNLAALYDSQGRYDAAEPLLLEALKLYKDLLGDRHPDVASSLNNLAELHRVQGRYDDAETLYLEAVELFADLLGENHPNTKIVRKNFEIFLKEAIDQHRTAELSDHSLTQTLLQSLQNPPR